MIIYKYPISPISLATSIHLPICSEVLCVQMQHGKPMIWVQLPNAIGESDKTECRRFELIPTGINFNFVNKKYIGTVQDNELVWHLFEIKDA